MQEQQSRLGYLMKRLELTGKEMSEELSVDTTTISKWKNGQRLLSYRSKYTRMIAEYLLNCELEAKRSVVRDILSLYMPSLNAGNEEQVTDALSLWLTDYSEPEENAAKPRAEIGVVSGYDTNVSMFTGINGIEQALESFWKSTLKYAPEQDLIIVDFGDIDYEACGCSNIMKKSVQLLTDAIKYGHRIKIVDGAADVFTPYLTIFRWMSVYLSENVEVFYRQARDNRDNRYSINLLPGSLALYTMGLEAPFSAHHSILFRDEESVRFLESSAQNTLMKSQKMIETVRIENILDMLAVLDEHLMSKQLTYMLNPTPTFRSMPPELLKKVLEENEVSPDILEICLEANKQTREIRERCDYRQIYNLDAMERDVKLSYCVDYDLSAICSKEIRISRENLLAHMQHLRDTPNTESFTITLMQYDSLTVLPTNISMIVQDDRLVVAWDAKHYKCRMYSRALHLIGGFYNYMEEVWASIPSICKTDQWTEKQFNKLIGMLGSQTVLTPE